jgi:hypothetical protein
MDRKPNHLPRITSIMGLLTCTRCGLGTAYDDFVRQHRGWLVRSRQRAGSSRAVAAGSDVRQP